MTAAVPSPEENRNRANQLLAVTWVWCSLSLLLVSLRLYVRARITRNLWWDDWVMVFTMALTIAFSVFLTLYAAKGGARHVEYMSSAQIEQTTWINWASQTFCIMGLATGKVSVAILMGRLMSPSRWRKWVLYFLSISSLIVACVVIITNFAQCSPPRTLWIPSAGKCWDFKRTNDLDVAIASWSAFVDFALAMFGITLIWNLQMNKKTKVNISAFLGLGIFASICAAVKTSYLPTLTIHSDFTWITVDFLIWSALEVNIIIITGSIPTLRPIFLNLFDNILSGIPIRRKPHSKLPSSRDGPSHELRPTPIKIVQHANTISHEANCGWPTENGSRTSIVPKNRILEVTEMDMKFENREEIVAGQDEEQGWSASRAAMSARTVL